MGEKSEVTLNELGARDKIKVRQVNELLLQSVDLSEKSQKTENNNLSIDQEVCYA